jgi:capsular polysaccharide transport system permease protein
VSGTTDRPDLIDCARTQLRVIGALMVREMHARFGRHRFGYLGLFIEPLLLGAAIGLIHQWGGGSGMRGSFEFFSVGYVLFFKFRGIVTRAYSTIASGTSLLYHRQVTLPDLFYARNIIEAIACSGVMAIFIVALISFGADPPDSPTKIIIALLLTMLLAQGIAMIFASVVSEWPGLERALHVTTYLLMPISGLFFMVEWLPAQLREWALLVPTVHLFELLRDGQFGDRFRPVYDLTYVGGWILVTHLLGLAGLRIVRRRIGLE